MSNTRGLAITPAGETLQYIAARPRWQVSVAFVRSGSRCSNVLPIPIGRKPGNATDITSVSPIPARIQTDRCSNRESGGFPDSLRAGSTKIQRLLCPDPPTPPPDRAVLLSACVSARTVSRAALAHSLTSWSSSSCITWKRSVSAIFVEDHVKPALPSPPASWCSPWLLPSIVTVLDPRRRLQSGQSSVSIGGHKFLGTGNPGASPPPPPPPPPTSRSPILFLGALPGAVAPFRGRSVRAPPEIVDVLKIRP